MSKRALLSRLMVVSRLISTGTGQTQSVRTRRVEFHTCSSHLQGRRGGTPEEEEGRRRHRPRRGEGGAKVFLLKNPISSLVNWWQLLALKNEWDPSFDSNKFIYGAKQAVVTVSSLISNNQFETLRSEGLLSSRAADGVKHESRHLDRISKSALKLCSEDIHVATVQGVNLHTIVDHRYADIDVLFVATKYGGGGGGDRPVVIYISSRFEREYTSGVIPSWTISYITYRFSVLEK